jgi:hypothetical protein
MVGPLEDKKYIEFRSYGTNVARVGGRCKLPSAARNRFLHGDRPAENRGGQSGGEVVDRGDFPFRMRVLPTANEEAERSEIPSGWPGPVYRASDRVSSIQISALSERAKSGEEIGAPGTAGKRYFAAASSTSRMILLLSL